MIGQLNMWNKDKVEVAIDRIREYEPEDGYYFGLSGGKDSDVVDKLLQLAGVKYERHHQHTTLDAPQTVRYIRENYPDTIIDLPKKSIWRLIEQQGMPPTRIMRYCCKELKEYGGDGRFKVLGVRWSESSKRKNNRKMVEACYKNQTRTLNPIVDWSDSEAWEFIKEYDIKPNPLYEMGWNRVGCIMCPQKGQKAMLQDAKMFPKYYENFLKAFDKMLKVRNEKGLKTTWNTAEEVMKWWLDICK